MLECPNCGTNFKVSAAALGDVGRTVRCSRCAFEWFAEPRDLKEPEPAPIVEEEETGNFEEMEAGGAEEFSEDILSALGGMEPEESAEAALERRAERRRNAGAYTPPPTPVSLIPSLSVLSLSILLLIAGAMAYFNEPLRGMGLGGLYDAIGMEESHSVKLANLSITKLPNKQRTTYALHGNVVNTGEEEQPIPAVRIRLMAENGEVLREWKYAQPGMMKPHETLPFSADKLDAAYKNQAHHFQVDIGSGFETALRD